MVPQKTNTRNFEAHRKKAKDEVRKVLIDTAKNRKTIAYSDLVKLIESWEILAKDKQLDDVLSEISVEEYKCGRGMLSVVVVHKRGDMQPGPGIYKLAKELGIDTSDKLKTWADQLNTVHKQWSGNI